MRHALDTTPALVKLVVFVTATLVATGILAVAISNANFTPKNTYRAVFDDAVGVREGDDVRMAGVRVGSVEDIELHENANALVTFAVEEDVALAPSTQVDIRYRNLIGQRYLALSPTPDSARRLPPGSTIPMSQTRPALDLNVLFNGFKPLLTALDPAQVNVFTYELVRVLQGEGGTIASLLNRLSSVTNELADRDVLIGEVIGNLNAVLGPIDAHSQELAALLTNLQQLVSGLAGDRVAIGDSLASISELADTTAGLLDDARPALETDLAELEQLAAGLSTPENLELIEYNANEYPRKLRLTMPLVSYGSWVNFYLCAVNFKYGPTLEDSTPIFFNSAPRCDL